jgi:hypothetical protein
LRFDPAYPNAAGQDGRPRSATPALGVRRTLLQPAGADGATSPRRGARHSRIPLHLHGRRGGLLRRAGRNDGCHTRVGCHVVAGNCEEQLAASADDCACGFEEGSECERLAKGWYPFADARISPASRAWMADLPKAPDRRRGRLEAARDPWRRRPDQPFRLRLRARGHRAGVGAGRRRYRRCRSRPACRSIEKVGRGAWFNPGVIGMPANDGTPDVWYGLIGLEAGHILLSTRRLAYDHIGAAAAMRRSGQRRRLRALAGDRRVAEPRRAPTRGAGRDGGEAAPTHRADPCSHRTGDGAAPSA